MRTTKTLALSAAVLAAGLAAASAQVYSANVVGYVNKAFSADYSQYFISTPLDDGTNTLKSLFASAPDQTAIIRWNVVNQDWDPIQTFTWQKGSGVWLDGLGRATNVVLYPGEGYFVSTSTAFTNTFVGNVLQGSLTNGTPITGNYAQSFIGSMVPVGGNVTNVLAGYTPADNDAIQLWDDTTQDWSPTVYTYQAGPAAWNPVLTTLQVGQGINYTSTKATDAQWIRTFTVQ
jgi:hypothetical protein